MSNIDLNEIVPEIISEITGCTLCYLVNDNIDQVTYNNLSQTERKIYNLIKSNYNRNICSIKNVSDLSNLPVNEIIEIMIKFKNYKILNSIDGYKYPDNARFASVGCTIYITNNNGIIY